MRIVLLPGLDGTGRLFAPLLSHLEAQVVAYPALGSYDALLAGIVLPGGPVTLVAESFSGPIAIRLAARGGVDRLVLVSTFARSPLPWLPPWLVRFRPPAWAMAPVLLGWGAPSELVSDLKAAVREIPTPVLLERVREVLRVDVRRELASLRIPTLALRGRQDWLVRPQFPATVLDGPHLLLQRRPAECAALIQAFSQPK